MIGFAGNEIVAQWRIMVGRQIGSAALIADGLHARTDGLTSLAVVLGAAGVALWAERGLSAHSSNGARAMAAVKAPYRRSSFARP